MAVRCTGAACLSPWISSPDSPPSSPAREAISCATTACTRPTPAIDIGSCPSRRHPPCPARRRLHRRVRAPPLPGCNDCGAPSVSMSAAARAVGRPFEFSHTSPTRGSSPPSSSTLPLAMPHPNSPAHRPDPELLPIHPPRLAISRSSPKTALAYTIPAYAFSLSDCQLSSPTTVRLLPLNPLLARLRRPPATPPAEQYFLYTLDRRFEFTSLRSLDLGDVEILSL